MKRIATLIILMLIVLFGFSQTNITNKYIVVHRSWGDYVVNALGRTIQINSEDSITTGTRTFYVDAVNGNDNNSGMTLALPWKTLDKINNSSFNSDDIIMLKRNQSHIGTITVPSSGSSGLPITITSYGSGEKPVITGFTTITGWTDEGGGIYSKTLTVESNPEIVTINGVQYAMGRTPNSDRYNPEYDDYFHIDSEIGDSIIIDTEIPEATNDWTGATAIIKCSVYNRWLKSPITDHTGNTITISTTVTEGGEALANGFGYFIQNDLRTLDQFGEWYYGGGKFYMYFGAVDPNSYAVKVSTRNKLVDINTRDFITVKNIQFEGANQTAVATNTSAGAYNLTVDNCNFNFNHLGIYGHRAYELTVTNCNFVNSTHQAIFNHWYSDGAYIAHNTIDSTGLVIGAGSSSWYTGKAMTVTYSRHDYSAKNTIIEYNTVTNSGFTGIHFGGDSVIVRYNFVDTYGLNKADNGGIQFGDQNTAVNMKVLNNIVLNGMINTDAHGLPSGTSGGGQFNIYFDYISDGGHTVSGNTIANLKAGTHDACGIMIHGSPNMTVTNNIIYNTKQGIKFQELNGLGYPARNNVVTGNKIVVNNNQYAIWARSIINDFNQYGTINNNYYSSPINYTTIFGTLVDTWATSSRAIDNWKTYSSHDTNSYMTYNTGSDIIFDYNNTNVAKTVLLSGSYMEADSTEVSNSYTLPPFAGIVLFKDTITTIEIDSMYAVYPLNGNANDTIGSQNGTINGAVISEGKFKWAYDFDNVTDNIYFPINTSTFNVSGRYSVSMWVKLDILPSTAGRNYHLFHDILSGPSYKVSMYITTANTLTVTTRNTVPSSFSSTSAAGVIANTGQWYHIVVNIPIVGDAAQIYVNGVRSTGATNTVMTGTARTSNYRFYLGDYLTTPVNTLDGQIDEFKIRNKWYSAEEVEYEYNNGAGRPY